MAPQDESKREDYSDNNTIDNNNCENIVASDVSKEPDDLLINDFQDILAIVGSQGWYQKRLLYFIVSPIVVLEGLLSMNMLFLIFVPDHYCTVPGMIKGVFELEELKNLSLPREMGADGRERYSRCLMYNPNGNGSSIPCMNGWKFNRTDYDNTLVTEFNWVCSRAEYPTHVMSVGAFGGAVGQVVLGSLADKFGRRRIFVISLFLAVTFRFASFFCPQTFTLFLIAHFLSAAGMRLVFDSPTMIAAELCDNDYRTRVYSFTWMVWVVGLASLPLIAWICRDWFLIAMISTVPSVLCLLFYLYLPESPRWLCSRGRIDEAVKIVLDVAKINGKEEKINKKQLGAWLQRIFDLHKSSKESCEGFWSFFQRWRLARNTIMISICWAVNSVIYDSITINTPNMLGNQFLNYFLLSITEIPASLLADYLLQSVGRRWIQTIFFVLGGIGCFVGAVLAFYPELHIASIIVVIFAKFCLILTYLVVSLQSTELFPTKLRSTGNSICSTFAGSIAVFGPRIVYAGQFNAGAPYLAMGGFAMLGAIAASILPETLHQNLPESLEDANQFGKHHAFCGWLPKDGPSLVQPGNGTANPAEATNEPGNADSRPDTQRNNVPAENEEIDPAQLQNEPETTSSSSALF